MIVPTNHVDTSLGPSPSIAFLDRLSHHFGRATDGDQKSLRSLLDRQGIRWHRGRSRWTDKSIAALKLMARLATETRSEDLWRFELQMELESVPQLQALINQVEDKLDGLAKDDVRVQQLQSIPGVGSRLAEVVVAVIDDATRFKNAKQVPSSNFPRHCFTALGSEDRC